MIIDNIIYTENLFQSAVQMHELHTFITSHKYILLLFPSPVGLSRTDTHNGQLPVGLLAQLAEDFTAIAEV